MENDSYRRLPEEQGSTWKICFAWLSVRLLCGTGICRSTSEGWGHSRAILHPASLRQGGGYGKAQLQFGAEGPSAKQRSPGPASCTAGFGESAEARLCIKLKKLAIGSIGKRVHYGQNLVLATPQSSKDQPISGGRWGCLHLSHCENGSKEAFGWRNSPPPLCGSRQAGRRREPRWRRRTASVCLSAGVRDVRAGAAPFRRRGPAYIALG